MASSEKSCTEHGYGSLSNHEWKAFWIFPSNTQWGTIDSTAALTKKGETWQQDYYLSSVIGPQTVLEHQIESGKAIHLPHSSYSLDSNSLPYYHPKCLSFLSPPSSSWTAEIFVAGCLVIGAVAILSYQTYKHFCKGNGDTKKFAENNTDLRPNHVATAKSTKVEFCGEGSQTKISRGENRSFLLYPK